MKINDRSVLAVAAAVFGAFAVAVAVSGGGATRATAVVAVVVGLLAAVVAQWRLSRQGRLILRDPGDRHANARRIARSRRRFAPISVGIGVGAVAPLNAPGQLHLVGVAAAEVISGIVLGCMPVLLWIAFRLRPDEHRSERL